MTDSPSNPTSGDALLNRAISLASKGYHVFPAAVVRRPDGTKDVRTVDWGSASTPDLDVVRAWFSEGHAWTDVCIDCGKSGIVVVDLDVRPGEASGLDVWRALAPNDERTDTKWSLETPGGGRHLYFRNDPREVIGSRNGAWEHVDVKGAGGMVFAYGFVPKARDLPLRPGWLAERVRVVGGETRPAISAGQDRSEGGSERSEFTLPGQIRAFTRAQAEAFCAGAYVALVDAPRGVINERLNEAACVFSHFVPGFWSQADVTAWLIEGQRKAWLAAGGADDRDYDSATATITSGLGQVSDPWRAVLAADAPVAFGGVAQEGAPVTPEAVEAARAGLAGEFLTVDGLASLEPPEPLVSGVLYRRTLASLTGAYGSLKTFVGLDLALCVASGTAWHGRDVTKGKVWYLLAEGVSGLQLRVAAWKDEWARQNEGLQLDLSGVAVLPRAVQVTDLEWTALLELAAVERPELVVVDTKARFTVGLEENSASETAIAVGRLDALKVAAGGTVLVVHHTGWSAERMRGSSAWGGALDTDLLVEKVGVPGALKAKITAAKQKDADEFEPFELVTKVVDLGMDVHGKVVTSLAFDALPFDVAPPADQQITGALDVTEEQHPEVLADLVAVMESVAPAGSRFGRSQAEIRALMLLGGAVHPAVRRVATRGARAGQRGYERAAIHQAFVLAAAYGWLEPAETPSKFTVLSERGRSEALAEWRLRVAQDADKTGH